MTARKVHFTAYFSTDEAICGSVPRGNAPALELSKLESDTTCEKCINSMLPADINPEHMVAAREADTTSDWDSVTSIASRNGVTIEDIAVGLTDGYLKL